MRHKPVAAASAAVLAAALAIGAPGTAHADDIRDNQWYLNTLDIDKVHELSQGAGVTIGVIDGGIDAEQQDLTDNIKAGAEFADGKIADGDGLEPGDGHGTAVAATIAGPGHGDNGTDGIIGLAPKATIISVDISDDDTTSVATAITWLVDNGADIINVSSGGGAPANGREALQNATDNGVAVVGSAGNLETNTPWGSYENPVTGWPARGQNAIPVSGTTQDNKFWENSTTLEDAALSPQLGLSAPAVDIPVALPDNEYDTVNGTSFSAPIVAGTLALIKSAYPDLDYYQWTDRLLDTVDDKGDNGYDDKYGWGIVNPYKALTEETVFEGTDGDQVSSPDDRLPLDQQGKDTGDGGGDAAPGDDATTGDDSAAALDPNAGVPTWAIIAAAALVLVIAAGALILTIRSRNKQPRPHPAPPATTTGTHQQLPTPPGVQPPGTPGPAPSGQPAPPGQQPPSQPTGTKQPPVPGQPHQPGQPPAGPPPPDQNPYLNRPPN